MLIERELYIEKIKASYQLLPVTVLIGCRQVGKTSLLNLIRVNLDHVFLNGQDPDVAIVFESVPNAEAFLRVNLNERFAGFVIIDEFQYLNNISTFIKILTDKHPDLKFICSGSSSLDILQNVNESLAGRVRIIEIFSLSWPEYILFNDKELYQKFLKCDKDENLLLIDSRFAPIFSEYLLFGGFPRLAAIRGHEEKINLLNDIYVTYLLKDVRAYIRNQDSIGFNKMLRMLSLQIGNMINVNELSNKSGLPYKKAEEYLWLLEQMYIIKLVEPYTTNKRKSLSKMKKMYFTDTGLRNIIAGNFNDMAFRNDSGSI
ncbi:MAG: ATP-binding protein, partial [Candidatus Atribacteria bacterium]|nr:ATP-binding protein [Candidatus Atribacteria bacterium]